MSPPSPGPVAGGGLGRPGLGPEPHFHCCLPHTFLLLPAPRAARGQEPSAWGRLCHLELHCCPSRRLVMGPQGGWTLGMGLPKLSISQSSWWCPSRGELLPFDGWRDQGPRGKVTSQGQPAWQDGLGVKGWAVRLPGFGGSAVEQLCDLGEWCSFSRPRFPHL